MQPDQLRNAQNENNEDSKEANDLLDNFLCRLKTEGPEVWSEVCTEVLKTLNIQPDWIKSQAPFFSEMRKRLDTEPGILIANHPSVMDLFLVLSQIKRKDLLVMLQRKRFAFFESVMGKDHILQAPHGEEEMTATIERVKQHINAGGLFIIFPSSGAETATGELSFKSGFRVLLSAINSNAMIYSFHVDPTAGEKIQKELVGPPRNINDKPLLLAPELHIRPSSKPLIVKMDESYSTAAEWQTVVGESHMLSKEKQNNVLLKIFKDKFK